MRLRTLRPTLLLLLLSSPALAETRYHLTEIPTLGGDFSVAQGINNKGQITGGASRANGIRRGLIYDNGVMTELGSLYGDNGESLGVDINEQGQVAGQSETAPGYYFAVRFDRDRIIYIGSVGDGSGSLPVSINSRGTIVGRIHVVSDHWATHHAFIFDGQNLVDLTSEILYRESSAGDINDRNEFVGSYQVDDNHSRAFLYDGASRHDLTIPGASLTGASGINELGQILGSMVTASSEYKPIIYQDGNIRVIPPIGSRNWPWKLNNNVQIVGDYQPDPNKFVYAPFIFDGINTLDLSSLVESPTGFNIQRAMRVNDLGEIVGWGQINGQTHGFLLTPTQWKNDSDGLWSDPANWLPNTIPDSLTANSNFLAMTTTPRTITLDSSRSTRTLNFRNPNSYTIAATNNASLTLGDSSNPAMINVIEGNHTIAAPLTLAGSTILNITDTNTLALSGPFSIAANTSATKWGDGTIEISGPQSHSPGASLRITRGHLILASNAGPNLSLSITFNPDSAPATVTFNSDQDLSNLSIDFASNGLQTLDLSGHTLAIRPPDLASAKSSLLSALHNAKSNPLDGLLDSTLSANSTIALLEFPDHLLLRQALNGDLNLDGSVTIADFIQLSSHFGASGPNITWQEGDLNYDNAVTISDFIDLASNFGASYSGTSTPIDGVDLATLNAFAQAHGATPVPEPALIGLAAVWALAITRRKRCCQTARL